MSDGRLNSNIDTRIDKANAEWRGLNLSLVTKRVSNTAKLLVVKSFFSPIFTYVYKSWQNWYLKYKRSRPDFCEKFTTCHFATKCAAAKYVRHWMSSHVSFEWKDLNYDVYVTRSEFSMKDWRCDSCWLHPRKKGLELGRNPGGVITTLFRFGVETADLSEVTENREVFRVLPGSFPRNPPRGNVCVKMNEMSGLVSLPCQAVNPNMGNR